MPCGCDMRRCTEGLVLSWYADALCIPFSCLARRFLRLGQPSQYFLMRSCAIAGKVWPAFICSTIATLLTVTWIALRTTMGERKCLFPGGDFGSGRVGRRRSSLCLSKASLMTPAEVIWRLLSWEAQGRWSQMESQEFHNSPFKPLEK